MRRSRTPSHPQHRAHPSSLLNPSSFPHRGVARPDRPVVVSGHYLYNLLLGPWRSQPVPDRSVCSLPVSPEVPCLPRVFRAASRGSPFPAIQARVIMEHSNAPVAGSGSQDISEHPILQEFVSCIARASLFHIFTERRDIGTGTIPIAGIFAQWSSTSSDFVRISAFCSLEPP